MKNSRLFICILGLLAVSLWSTSAFAQAALAVSSVPRTTAISTGHTEIAGDLFVSSSAVGALGAGTATLTVDYGVPITDGTAGFITVCGASFLAGPTVTAACPSGQFTFLTTASGVPGTFSIGGSNQNQVLIVLPNQAANVSTTASLTVTGVKVSLATFTGTKLSATLGVSASATFGAYSIGSGQNITDVISAVLPAFTTLVATGSSALPNGTATGQVLSTATVSDRTFNIDVPENFVDAFKTTIGQSGFLNDPAITFTFTGIPAGVNLNLAGGVSGTSNALCSAATGDTSVFYPVATATATGPFTAIPVANLSNTVINSSTNSTVLTFTGLAFNATIIEAIRVRGCIFTSGATPPLPLGTVVVSATLSPNGSALSAGAQIVPVAGNYPRFANAPVTLNIITIVAAETDMLISFAVKNTGGFDTGIAIANTSSDPFGSSLGVTPNDGTLVLNFYPQGTGSSFSYTTTTGSPGSGLATGGVLSSGKTWSVLLSELLGGITGAPTAFTGYIFVRANFTNAHGAAYVTDFKGFTSSSPFLIVPTGRVVANESLGH